MEIGIAIGVFAFAFVATRIVYRIGHKAGWREGCKDMAEAALYGPQTLDPRIVYDELPDSLTDRKAPERVKITRVDDETEVERAGARAGRGGEVRAGVAERECLHDSAVGGVDGEALNGGG